MAIAVRQSALVPALALCAGLAVLSAQDAIVKALSGDYPVHEAVVLRTLGALPVIALLVAREGGLRAAPGERRWLALRGAVMFLAYTAYYLALPAMPLASAIALWFVAPLFLVALSGPIAGERVPRSVWASVAVGFLGVVVMLRPGGGLVSWAVALPLGSALTYAIAQLMARRLRIASAVEMAFHQTLVYGVGAVLLAGALAPVAGAFDDDPSLDFLLRAWAMPSGVDLALLVACGPIAAVGSTLLCHAYRVAGGAVGPFEYSALIWATLWGVLLWDEVPDAGAIVGAVLIVGSGLYAATRSGRREARGAP